MDEIDIFKKEIEVLDLCIAFDIEYDPNLFNNRVVRDRARNFKNRDIGHIRAIAKKKIGNTIKVEAIAIISIWKLEKI